MRVFRSQNWRQGDRAKNNMLSLSWNVGVGAFKDTSNLSFCLMQQTRAWGSQRPLHAGKPKRNSQRCRSSPLAAAMRRQRNWIRRAAERIVGRRLEWFVDQIIQSHGLGNDCILSLRLGHIKMRIYIVKYLSALHTMILCFFDVACVALGSSLHFMIFHVNMPGSWTCVRRFTWPKKRGIETQNWILEVAAIAIDFITSLDSVLCFFGVPGLWNKA